MTLRLALFGDSRSYLSTLFAERIVRLARVRRDVQIVAICDAGLRAPLSLPIQAGHALTKALVKRLFDAAHPLSIGPGHLYSIRHLATCHGIPLVLPPGHDINHPQLAAHVAERLQASCALAVGCVQIFRPALLAAFAQRVNYHNSLLPAYAGFRATRWSVYHREKVTGFTFHRMSEGLDEGPILVQGALPIRPDIALDRLEAEKTQLALRCLPRLFDALLATDPGLPQVGERSYFGAKAMRQLQTIADPATVSFDELARRLHAFDLVNVQLGSQIYPVTKLRRATKTTALSFRTQDGVLVEPTRFGYLPHPLHRLWRRTRRWRTGRSR